MKQPVGILVVKINAQICTHFGLCAQILDLIGVFPPGIYVKEVTPFRRSQLVAVFFFVSCNSEIGQEFMMCSNEPNSVFVCLVGVTWQGLMDSSPATFHLHLGEEFLS